MGRLIVIDGLDASGKETQTELLAKYLKEHGKRVRVLSFPMYDSDSSAFVRMYLSGALGSRPEDTNAFAASSFLPLTVIFPTGLIGKRMRRIRDNGDCQQIHYRKRGSSACKASPQYVERFSFMALGL